MSNLSFQVWRCCLAYSLAHLPRRSRAAGSLAKDTTARAMVDGSASGNKRPLTPSWIMALVVPTSHVTMGFPHARASRRVLVRHVTSHGWITRSAIAMKPDTSEKGIAPENRTKRFKPKRVVKCSRSDRSDPWPPRTSLAVGTSLRMKGMALMARSCRFEGASRPRQNSTKSSGERPIRDGRARECGRPLSTCWSTPLSHSRNLRLSILNVFAMRSPLVPSFVTINRSDGHSHAGTWSRHFRRVFRLGFSHHQS